MDHVCPIFLVEYEVMEIAVCFHPSLIDERKEYASPRLEHRFRVQPPFNA